MKTIYKVLAAAAIATPLFTSCIEEAIPTNTITQGQLNTNPGATEALVQGMPGRMNVITLDNTLHFDYGYSSMMHIRDVLLEDMSCEYAGGFDWYSSWSANENTSDSWVTSQVIWNYFYEQILTTNLLIGAIDDEVEDSARRIALGQGYAYRALIYLDAARMYEFLPTELYPDNLNDDGNFILGLTLAKVTDETPEDELRKNPRMPHKEAVEFILSDLEKAAKLLEGAPASAVKNLPSLAVVYGLMARTYLWDATFIEECNTLLPAEQQATVTAADQYANAAKYARLAISTSGARPLTADEWLDTTRGFNSDAFSSWMMSGKYSAEDDVVVAGGIRTFASFCCNEENFGYAAPAQGAFTMIGASLYKKINDADFRKLSWFAPDDSPLRGQEHFIDKDFAEQNFYEYVSLKFRPGSGEMNNYNIGAVTDYPLMRVEEMYFIEAEATAHTNPAAGNDLLKSFMTTYRYPSYTNTYTSTEGVVDEIVLQKRIELWGEGQAYFDVKRLGYSVIRAYDGSNFTYGLNTFNTNGRPAWMNFCIVRQETNNNEAIKGYNTPNYEGKYTAIDK